MKNAVVMGTALSALAVLCACGGGGSSSSAPGGGDPAKPIPTTAPAGSPTPAPGATATPSPGTIATAAPTTLPVLPTPTPVPPPAGSVIGVSAMTTASGYLSNNSYPYGPLVLVAPDGATFAPNGPDSYAVATLFDNGSAIVSPQPAWAAGGVAGLAAGVTAGDGTQPGAGQTIVGAGSPGAAGAGTLTAGGGVSIAAYVYPRFTLGCGSAGQSAEFPAGIVFNANGTTSTVTDPATADIALTGISCVGAFANANPESLAIPGGEQTFLEPPNASSVTEFAALQSSQWTNFAQSIAYAQIARETTGGYGLPIIIKTRAGAFVKLLITYRTLSVGTSYQISGAYEVQGAPPADGF